VLFKLWGSMYNPNMSQTGETFFTVVGCMDGRCQIVVADYGKKTFGAIFPDTITEPGIVGMLSGNPSHEFLENLKKKIHISLEKHHSQGIVVDGHAECAGNPVDDQTHKDNVKKSVEVIKSMVDNSIPVTGVFAARNDNTWEVSEIVPAKVLV